MPATKLFISGTPALEKPAAMIRSMIVSMSAFESNRAAGTAGGSRTPRCDNHFLSFMKHTMGATGVLLFGQQLLAKRHPFEEPRERRRDLSLRVTVLGQERHINVIELLFDFSSLTRNRIISTILSCIQNYLLVFDNRQGSHPPAVTSSPSFAVSHPYSRAGEGSMNQKSPGLLGSCDAIGFGLAPGALQINIELAFQPGSGPLPQRKRDDIGRVIVVEELLVDAPDEPVPTRQPRVQRL